MRKEEGAGLAQGSARSKGCAHALKQRASPNPVDKDGGSSESSNTKGRGRRTLMRELDSNQGAQRPDRMSRLRYRGPAAAEAQEGHSITANGLKGPSESI
eukprot:GHVU01176661.1.p2 GENE.GHVU01176661.1~~GHVU01176661.1.p2  ORF type:complete len:100 (+),score=6.11 GHVU01176661.1:190-489(+)